MLVEPPDLADGGRCWYFAFAYWRFSFAERAAQSQKKKRTEQKLLAHAASSDSICERSEFGAGAQWAQFLGKRQARIPRA